LSWFEKAAKEAEIDLDEETSARLHAAYLDSPHHAGGDLAI